MLFSCPAWHANLRNPYCSPVPISPIQNKNEGLVLSVGINQDILVSKRLIRSENPFWRKN